MMGGEKMRGGCVGVYVCCVGVYMCVVCVCVCEEREVVCVCVCVERERERERENISSSMFAAHSHISSPTLHTTLMTGELTRFTSFTALTEIV